MIAGLIEASIQHRRWVLAACALALLLMAALAWRVKLDALPDLSETQVVLKARLEGATPTLVEDQLTYPLTTELLGLPGAQTVRGFSMFGEAFVYVVFGEDVRPEQARARVLERLPSLGARLPAAASVVLGPDASGTGWIYQYALTSQGGPGLDALRVLQDTQLRPELQAVPGVAEVATFGGAPRQLQIELLPERMGVLGVTAEDLMRAVRGANRAVGGGALELGRQRFLVSADARLQPDDDWRDLPVKTLEDGTALRLGQVARVRIGPGPVEGVGALSGQGEVVGGIVVMRQGANAYEVLQRVQERVAHLRERLPAGVALVETYNRAGLIERAVRSLGLRLAEEALVVGLVCALFLGRLRSALVALVTLPLGLLAALALLQAQGVTANVMSLGGLAIAIGAMIDASVVMVETLHRRLEAAGRSAVSHWALVAASAREVGPALFFSLLIITVSFLPVFSLQGAEGRLFSPLALTKTYAMAAAAALSITLVPVLMGLFVRGPVQRERRNPLNRLLRRAYRPALRLALNHPRWALGLALAVALSAVLPLQRMGTEFMPPLDEGDLLYMPTTLPSVSVEQAKELLRRTNALIAAQPEVALVHGKAGRSDSATDPAPLSMIESVIVLKPRAEWPEPISTQALMQRLQQQVRLAGLSNAWGFPIRTRIDMLSTGVKTPLALKLTGDDPVRLQALAERAEQQLAQVPGVASALTERTQQGRYLRIELDRPRAQALGVEVGELADLVQGPLGGMPFDVLSVGRERLEVVLRYPQATRQSAEAIGHIRLRGQVGGEVLLSQVARIRLSDGPSEVRSDNARPVAYVLLTLGEDDAGSVLRRAEPVLQALALPPGYAASWVGQHLRLKEARWRLLAISTATLLAVAGLLYLHFRCAARAGVVLASLPIAVAGGLWLSHALGFKASFATIVGLIALAGVAAEFCVVMLLYLDQAVAARRAAGWALTPQCLRAAVLQGALLRLRPKTMTAAVIVGGLLPMLLTEGVGVEVMSRIAAPMVGGMLTAPLFSLLVLPSLYVWAISRKAGAPRTSLQLQGSAA
ncbi:efflux RND transporter permease subunit [Inhella sp. 1Y17]|uniref:Efflux RND transporter permease subunit n=1 Tax=Inhella proteolytica TaxID=2795029 RepID=A0A931J353_9BURK|nr:efflux RND transporter permease subunit [Inhella proteolytica]